jgi:internalin A
MRKFELCFDLENYIDRKFLVPDLLSKEEPYTGPWDNTLTFQYHYDVLPGSVITRFIVRMASAIYRSTYWRSGVVLEYQGNKALVKADIEDGKIYVWLDGPLNSRRNFLSYRGLMQ